MSQRLKLSFELFSPSRMSSLSRLVRSVLQPVILGTMLVGAMLVGATGCSLDVSSPTTLRENDLENPDGVSLFLNTARFSFANAVTFGMTQGGLLTDEFFWDADPNDTGIEATLDRRESVLNENRIASDFGLGSTYYYWQKAWVDAQVALASIQNYALASSKNMQLAEIFTIRGYIMLGLAEQICPGFPLRTVDIQSGGTWTPTYHSVPMTTDSVFKRAAAEFDSALVYVSASDAARLGKARALLGLGQTTAAGTLAATVDPAYVATNTEQFVTYTFFQLNAGSSADNEGVNGVNFISSGDPRISFFPLDSTNSLPRVMKYLPIDFLDNFEPNIIFASGREAQLIKAEGELAAGSGNWLTTLNALRANAGIADTTDPVTAAARVNLIFHERAYWLYATGHRLGDMRRLVAHYGRNPETVFPTGVTRGGAPYGTATSMPFPGDFEHAFNPAITGCTSR